jgi:hypothetical protein
MKKSVLVLSEIHPSSANSAKHTIQQTIHIWLAKELHR